MDKTSVSANTFLRPQIIAAGTLLHNNARPL